MALPECTHTESIAQRRPTTTTKRTAQKGAANKPHHYNWAHASNAKSVTHLKPTEGKDDKDRTTTE